MGRQYNKVEKRKRRAAYLKRKQAVAKTKAAPKSAWSRCKFSPPAVRKDGFFYTRIDSFPAWSFALSPTLSLSMDGIFTVFSRRAYNPRPRAQLNATSYSPQR